MSDKPTMVDESVTGLEYRAPDGTVYDLANISGTKKAELILSGSVSMDRFVTPPNMPGSKLKLLREQHQANMSRGLKRYKEQKSKENKEPENTATYAKGDMVVYHKVATKVLAVKDSKVKIKLANGEKTWIPEEKVKPFKEPVDNE